MVKKFRLSAFVNLPLPSARFVAMDSAALFNWSVQTPGASEPCRYWRFYLFHLFT